MKEKKYFDNLKEWKENAIKKVNKYKRNHQSLVKRYGREDWWVKWLQEEKDKKNNTKEKK